MKKTSMVIFFCYPEDHDYKEPHRTVTRHIKISDKRLAEHTYWTLLDLCRKEFKLNPRSMTIR